MATVADEGSIVREPIRRSPNVGQNEPGNTSPKFARIDLPIETHHCPVYLASDHDMEQ